MCQRAFCLGLLAVISLAWIDLGHSKTRLFEQSGLASWYGPWHHGRRTAKGEIFSRFKLTAAHLSLPLGSWVCVTNLRNCKNVVVQINDRGPYIHPRIVDLSKAAARRIDMMQVGVQLVRIIVLSE